MKQPQKNNPRGAQVQFTQATIYQGQLPPPEMLEHFERIQPGFTNRLLTMVETESSHRKKEETALRRQVGQSAVMGMVCALLAVLIVSSVSALALYLGAFTAASAIMASSVTAVIVAFVSRNRYMRKAKSKQ